MDATRYFGRSFLLPKFPSVLRQALGVMLWYDVFQKMTVTNNERHGNEDEPVMGVCTACCNGRQVPHTARWQSKVTEFCLLSCAFEVSD